MAKKPSVSNLSAIAARRAQARAGGGISWSSATERAIADLKLTPAERTEIDKVLKKAADGIAKGDSVAWVKAEYQNDIDRLARQNKWAPTFTVKAKEAARQATVDAKASGTTLTQPTPAKPRTNFKPKQTVTTTPAQAAAARPARKQAAKVAKRAAVAKKTANAAAISKAATQAAAPAATPGTNLAGAAAQAAQAPATLQAKAAGGVRPALVRSEANVASRAARVAKVTKGRALKGALRMGGKVLGGIGLALTAAEIASMLYENGPGRANDLRQAQLEAALNGTVDVEQAGALSYEQNLSRMLSANEGTMDRNARRAAGAAGDTQRLIQMLSQDRVSDLGQIAVQPRVSLAELMAEQGVM